MPFKTARYLKLLALIPLIKAIPSLDYESLGTVSILGSFAAIDDISNQSTPDQSFNNQTNTLMKYNNNNATDFITVGSTNEFGHIYSACTIGDMTFIGGDFGSVDDQQITTFGVYSERYGWQALTGVDGVVHALHCDSSSSQIWVGGSFESLGDDMGDNIAIWNVLEEHWQPSPIYGLNGPVTGFSITNDQLFITGNFTTRFEQPDEQLESALDGIVSALQPLSYSNAEVKGSQGSNDEQYSNINNLACINGNSWNTLDGANGVMSVEWSRTQEVAGFRIANTVDEGHSLSGFTISSITDNEVIPLIYNDVNSPFTNSTCETECPIPSASEREFNNYIIPGGPRRLSGFSINLVDWSGAGPGLRSLEVLSSGSNAYAVNDFNELDGSCYSNFSPSNVTTVGDWTEINPSSESENRVLTTTVRESDASSVIFEPYVGRRGLYDITLSIPGCVSIDDCDARSTISIEMQLTDGGHYINDTISEINEQNSDIPLFRGIIDAKSDEFVPRIVIKPKEIKEGKSLAIEKVSLELIQDLPTNIVMGGLAYNLTSDDTFDASSIRLLNDQSYVDHALVALTDSIGLPYKENVTDDNYIKSIVTVDETILIAGNFIGFNNTRNNISSIASFDNHLHSLPNGGIDGFVNKMIVVDDLVYIAGNFTKAGTIDCSNVVSYDYKHEKFESLANGINGEVYDIDYSKSMNRLFFTGNFTKALLDESASMTVGGVVSWDLSSKEWRNDEGVVFSSYVQGVDIDDEDIYIYGSINKVASFSATSGAQLTSHGFEDLKALKYIGSQTQSSNSTSNSNRKRAYPHLPISYALAPSINAGVFYENSTSSYTILGGNFTFDGDSSTVALIDENDNISPLSDNGITGDVKALLVVNDNLFIGGEIRAGNSSDVALYDLKNGKYINIGYGLEGVVTDFAYNEIYSSVVVAGDFMTVSGVQHCANICEWNLKDKKWNSIGDGVKGYIKDVEIAGDEDKFTIAVGEFAINDDSDTVYIAKYDNEDKVWSKFPSSLPGPATAVESDDKNLNNLFIAGRTSNNNETYIYNWNGNDFVDISNGKLQGNGFINHLQFLPINETSERDYHSTIEDDRILYLSGNMMIENTGSVSSVIYDGIQFYPHLKALNMNGDNGALSTLMFTSKFSFTRRNLLALGIIILISIALGLGAVLILTLIAVLISLWSRRGESYPVLLENPEDEEEMARPSSLLENINQATTNIAKVTPMQTTVPTPIIKLNDDNVSNVIYNEKKDKDNENNHIDNSFSSNDTSNDASSSAITNENNEGDLNNGVGYRCYARYDFLGERSGELPLQVGQQIQVLNDRDNDWAFVRDPATSQEGIVPTSYLF